MTVEVRPIEVPAREKTVADVLRHAARIIEERGWSQGFYEDGEGGVCALGATYLASALPEDTWGDAETEAERVLARSLPPSPSGMRAVPFFNDAEGRAADEVTAALRAAADAWEADHV